MAITITAVGVIDKNMLENLINKKLCSSIDDLEFEDTQDFDYAQMALVDMEHKIIHYWSDNVHSNPEAILKGIEIVQKFTNMELVLETKVMMEDELNTYSGVKYR